jgi:hypothetical protein
MTTVYEEKASPVHTCIDKYRCEVCETCGFDNKSVGYVEISGWVQSE